jgi:mono/diheme cytochrome c family protein
METMRLVRCCLAIAFTTGFAGVAASQDPIEHGRALVVENCSGCHAIGGDGESPHPQAPPFRKLSERFPIDALEETFVNSIDTGHPGMPVFDASRQQIENIVAYIGSVME